MDELSTLGKRWMRDSPRWAASATFLFEVRLHFNMFELGRITLPSSCLVYGAFQAWKNLLLADSCIIGAARMELTGKSLAMSASEKRQQESTTPMRWIWKS
jgi:hypothetical protein